MAEPWYALSDDELGEALEVAAAETGRPAHLLEKDIWVVWVLSAIYESGLAENLTFKGGTSLSKVYRIIDRFSEDIDLTYDLRALVSDVLDEGNPAPRSSSHARKITSVVRERLPRWISNEVRPVIAAALGKDGLEARVQLDVSGSDKLTLAYRRTRNGTGYAAPVVQLEFGARGTGEPHQVHAIACDIAPVIEGVVFPTARPLVMTAERTFWEKATAAHVFCLQKRLRGERYSRHWYDLAAIAQTPHFDAACKDSDLARAVAEHKAAFFSEKDEVGNTIDFVAAVSGSLQLIPTSDALRELERDYNAMREDGLLAVNAPTFGEVIAQCERIQSSLNAALAHEIAAAPERHLSP